MAPFAPNPQKLQIGPIFLHGTGSASMFTLDKDSNPALTSLTAIKWRATNDVRLRFNLERHPNSDPSLISDDGPFYQDQEGIIPLTPSIKSITFFSTTRSLTTIYFMLS